MFGHEHTRVCVLFVCVCPFIYILWVFLPFTMLHDNKFAFKSPPVKPIDWVLSWFSGACSPSARQKVQDQGQVLYQDTPRPIQTCMHNCIRTHTRGVLLTTKCHMILFRFVFVSFTLQFTCSLLFVLFQMHRKKRIRSDFTTGS